MTIDARTARLFGLDDEGWARHANPWSVHTRIPIPVLLAAAVWSRSRLGRWSLVPVAAVCAWAAVNPRAFPPPRSLDSWASRGVLGETVWGKRTTTPLPGHHRVAPTVLAAVSALGVPFIVRGLVVRDGWMVAFGLAVQVGAKVWFIDRMVLLYDEVTAAGREPGSGD
jgi:hypothetical protein